MYSLLFLLVVAALTFFATWHVKNYSIRTQLLAIPNERSSHSLPAPSGGGAGFVAVILLCGVLLCLYGYFTVNMLIALLGGGGGVACVGWLDDRHGVSAGIRFAVHCAVGIWTLFWVGVSWQNPAATLFFFVMIVWFINCYNFMDGIDGLAAGEAVVAGFLAAALCGGSAGSLCFLTASAVLGFLYWNWPRAKIFMGDAGSGILGYIFALAWLLETTENPTGFFTIPLLLACFLVDSVLTLLWRVCRGEKWYMAHRLHVYQTFAETLSHRTVTVVFMLITGVWLAPLAFGALEMPHVDVLFACVAYLPLLAFAVFVHKTKTPFQRFSLDGVRRE